MRLCLQTFDLVQLRDCRRARIQLLPQAIRAELQIVHLPEQVRFFFLIQQGHLVQPCQVRVGAARRSARARRCRVHCRRTEDLLLRIHVIETVVVQVAQFRPQEVLGTQSDRLPFLGTGVTRRGLLGGLLLAVCRDD